MKRVFFLTIFSLVLIFIQFYFVFYSYGGEEVQSRLNIYFDHPLFPLLDDFNDGDSLNNWLFYTFYGGEDCSIDVSCDNNGYEGKCLKIDYDVSLNNSYVWYISKMTEKDLTQSNFNGLKFWVKGEQGNELLKIELKSKGGNSTGRSNARVYVNDFIPDARITTSWQHVFIPFANFANITNFTDMEGLAFAVGNAESSENGSPLISSVYIDYITFTNKEDGFNTITIDNFGDKVWKCALGGYLGEWSGGGGTQTTEMNDIASHNSPNGLDYKYNVTSGWTVRYFIFGGGNYDGDAMPCDFSDYNKLTFWIKAKSASENPEQIKVGLFSPGDSSVYKNGITTTWQKFEIPLGSFSGLNKNAIERFLLTFEGGVVADKIGEVYIDEVQFEK